MEKKISHIRAAKLIGIHPNTLARWQELGEAKVEKDMWGRRVYTENDIKRLKIIKARHNKLRRSGSYFKGMKGSGKK